MAQITIQMSNMEIKRTLDVITNEIFNPHDKPIDELPTIYGFSKGNANETHFGCLLSEDGTLIHTKQSPTEFHLQYDLGILKDTQYEMHKYLRVYYPDGYRMEFVPSWKILNHGKLLKIMKIYGFNGIIDKIMHIRENL